ncbi:trimethylamine methyltransferase family protein [Pseudohalocynthiibacter sp. F2068]|jgi:trimethylamine---corrinoid protein Co-methyltransferase|uniref:trimethylamine methyltransferase family protein n=1 Tax=Pseudohalocynthiibacter sp. F2068 TaxID=2926418 RepID=UPI001FF21AFD|nr:trimethylamine methyltransferase family protein [Pseudohalocynthiibacter sp. F2068]
MSGSKVSKRRRNGPSRRRQNGGMESLTKPEAAFVSRSCPTYEILSEEGLHRIEMEADRILCEIGIDFKDHPATLEYFRKAGAKINGERVTFEMGMCREIIQASAPRKFVQYARNPERNVQIGGKSMVFSPLYGAPFVRSLDGERRYSTIEDFNNFVRLSHASPYLHHTGGTICEPTDIAVNKRHLDMIYGHLRYSDKPFMGAVTSREQARDSILLAQIAFGEDIVAQHCCLSAMINPTSPLFYDADALDSLEIYAENGQACVVTPFVIAGASGPITPAAILAQLLAEAMAGMALAQIIRPGSPVIFGINTMGLNMRSGAPIRFDESWKCVVAAGQLARRLGVPYRGGGSSTSSKIPDAQSGIESALYLNYTLLSGVNFLIHAAGSLEMGLCIDYRKFALDCDMLGSVTRMMKTVDVSDSAFALKDYIDMGGPGGNFLTASQTLSGYKDAFFDSQLFDSSSFEQWRENGSHDAAHRAELEIRRVLNEFEAPKLDASIDEALLDFIARRKSESLDVIG